MADQAPDTRHDDEGRYRHWWWWHHRRNVLWLPLDVTYDTGRAVAHVVGGLFGGLGRVFHDSYQDVTGEDDRDHDSNQKK